MKIVLLITLAIVCLINIAYAADDDVINLVCRVKPSFDENILELPVVINLKTMTANGVKATIEESTVTWISGSLSFSINRYSGTYICVDNEGHSANGIFTKIIGKKF